MLTTHILSDNAAFSAVGDLATAARRYRGDTAVQAEAKPLRKLASGNSFSGEDVANASTEIGNVCGHPLGLGSSSISSTAATPTSSPISDSNGSSTQAAFQSVQASGSPLPPEYSDAQQTNVDVAAGAQAPDLVGESFDGSSVQIRADGKPKIVLFCAHWSPHCQTELPVVARWLATNQSAYPNVEFFAVATGTSAAKANYPPADWFKTANYDGPVLVDDSANSAATAYGLGSYPYTVALDGRGKVVTRNGGELDATQFEDMVRQAAHSG